ncbi:HD-GYP domain-containing protein [Desulfurobacterium crinifex]
MGLEVVNFLRKKNVNRLFALVNLGITVLLAFPILGEVVFNYLSGNIELSQVWRMLLLYYTIPGIIQVVVSFLIYYENSPKFSKLVFLAPIVATVINIVFDTKVVFITETYFIILNFFYIVFYGWNNFLIVVYLVYLSLVMFSSPANLREHESIFFDVSLVFALLFSTMSGIFVNTILKFLEIQVLVREIQKNPRMDILRENLLKLTSYLGIGFLEINSGVDELKLSIGNPSKEYQEFSLGALRIKVKKPKKLLYRKIIVPSMVSLLIPVLLNMRQLIQERRRAKELIKIFTRTIELRDPYTRGHSDNVAYYALEIGKALGLSKSEQENLKIAALLHDVGKIVIPDKILLKPLPLTKEEFEIIKLHATVGYSLLNSIRGMSRIAKVVKHHHEKWDGSGYPDGLRGEEIPYLSRILAIADVFDALTSERPYRAALSKEEAFKIMEKNKKDFDPEIFPIAKEVLEKIPLSKGYRVNFLEAEILDRMRKLSSGSNIVLGNSFPEKPCILLVSAENIDPMRFIKNTISQFLDTSWFHMVEVYEGEFLVISDSKDIDYLYSYFDRPGISIKRLL